jgi:pantoate--beta-alanine ligase
MTIISTISELQHNTDQLRRQGKRIAVVPTMGYLHKGHTSLIKLARSEADVVITTIFVNPTQFAPTEDFDNYPRNINHDRALAAEAGTDILFTPTAEEMYPHGFSTFIEVGEVSSVLEGRFRPTHFRGVATVVAKLFNITKPHVAVFGQKDAQQAFIVRKLVKELNYDIEIIVGPIIREPDGLAMSSRNIYLNDDERKRAGSLFRALDHLLPLIQAGERNANVLRSEVERIIRSARPTAIDYIAFVDPINFQEMDYLQGSSVYVLLAVRFGKTRLIDNMLIEIPHR